MWSGEAAGSSRLPDWETGANVTDFERMDRSSELLLLVLEVALRIRLCGGGGGPAALKTEVGGAAAEEDTVVVPGFVLTDCVAEPEGARTTSFVEPEERPVLVVSASTIGAGPRLQAGT